MYEPECGDRQGRDRDDERRDGAEPAARPVGHRAPDRVADARGGLGLGLLVSQARPEHPPAEDPHRRRDEEHGDGEADQHDDGHRRPERAHEVDPGDPERGEPGGDDQPGGEHDRQHLRGRPARGRSRRLALAQSAEHPREEEDRVVGDDREQEHDDDRLHLVLDVHPEPRGQVRHRVDRDQVGEPGGGKRDERRDDRAQVQPEDHGDQEDRRQLDPEQAAVDLVRLRDRPRDEAGRVRAGARNRDRLGVVRRERVLLPRREAPGKAEVGDRRRAALARAADQPERVQVRQRA